MGILSIVPVAGLLALAFFVMWVLQKTEDGALKSFGRIAAATLCIAAAVVLIAGMFVLYTGNCPMMNMMGRCSVERYGCEKGTSYKHLKDKKDAYRRMREHRKRYEE